MKMIVEVVLDWRMWPLYILGLLHMSMLITVSRMISYLLLCSSTRWSASTVSDTLPPQSRLHHNPNQPISHSVERRRLVAIASRGIPK